MKLNMNRREFLAAFGTIAASAVLAGCSGKTVTTTGASSDAASTPAPSGDDKSAASTMKLIVGFDAAYPPYGYVGDDGSYTGFDLELAQEVGRRVGWEVQLEPIDWDAKDTLMNSGAINCIWNGFTIEGRENDYTFSEPYMLNAQVVVVKKGSGISDLAGSIAAYQLAAKPDAYEQLSEQLSSEHYAVGFKKGDEASATQVTDTLKAMDKDGFVKDLCDKYADQGMDYANWCLA